MFNKNLTRGLAIVMLVNSTWAYAMSEQNTASSLNKQASKTTHSVANFKHELVNGETSVLLKNADTTIRTLQHQGMLRAEIAVSRAHNQQAKLLNKGAVAPAQSSASTNIHHSFSIYTGYSELITDIDDDGYFQTFSVSFDADLLSASGDDQALVYADLYLSENGGPWILYFSTDDFIITGESSDDEFEVVTRLDSGYIPEHYDVLIDLYEVGYSEAVATYSANDTNALYAIPLESSDYDPEYIDVYYEDEHGGSAGGLLIPLLLLLFIRRRYCC